MSLTESNDYMPLYCKDLYTSCEEDFTAGQMLLKVLRSKPKNDQIMCNAACLVGNLATSSKDQLQHLSVIVFKFLKSTDNNITLHGMRAVLSLISQKPSNTVQELLRDGAGDMLNNIAILPGVVDAIQTSLLTQTPSRSRSSVR